MLQVSFLYVKQNTGHSELIISRSYHKIIHLQFINDLIILAKVDQKNANNLMECFSRVVEKECQRKTSKLTNNCS